MDEVVFALSGAEGGNQFADPAAEMWNGSLGGLAEERLQFAEGLLDRIEVRRIFRQVKQFGVGGFDGLLHGDPLLGREVVDDDDVAVPECWRQTLFEIGKKGGSGHWPIHHKGSSHFVMAKPSHECDRLPMSLRHAADQPLAAPAAASKPYHVG